LGGEIDLPVVSLRIRRQRNRLVWRPTLMHCLPDFLGNEWHDRMQQTQSSLEQSNQISACDLVRLSPPRFHQPRLNQLDIPIAELSPEKIVNPIGCFVETIAFKRLIYVARNTIEPRQNPAIFQGPRVNPGDPTGHGDISSVGSAGKP